MRLTSNNKRGYLQVIISFFAIYCTIGMPIIKATVTGYSHFSLLYVLDAFEILEGIKELFFVLFFMGFITVHLVNIFFQSKKKSTILAIISGIFSFLILTTAFLVVKNAYEDFKLTLGFFIIIILIIAQILTATLFNKKAEVKHTSNVDSSPKKELSKKEQLEDELRQLQAQVKQIEKEEAKRKLELERAEKEKLENEKLMNEIAKLKEVIRNHKNK